MWGIEMRGLSRRGFLGMCGAGLLLPRRLAAESSNGRKFLFVFVQGGWDPSWVFAPTFDNPNLWIDPEATRAEIGGIPFTDAASRPSVRSFFERYASRTAIINGLEIRSVTHERCKRLLMTGTSQDVSDDWAAQIANGIAGYPLPCLVLSGPSYTNRLTSSVVRVGASGQLADLIDGSVLDINLPIMPLPSTDTEARMRAFVNDRVARFAAQAAPGQPANFASSWQTSLNQRELVSGMGDALAQDGANSTFTPVSERVIPILNCFEQGYSRCGLVQHSGEFDMGWDNHSNLSQQATHFELLFSDLNDILADLDQRPGTNSARLSDEVTLVVISEMGRAPTVNTTGGKDHWTFTSAMLIGAGIRGGQVVGNYNSYFQGDGVDLASGLPGETLLSAEHLGATLLALGDLDPGLTDPIAAVIA